MSINDLHKITSSFQPTEPMPVLFVGHGNPMNAIAENEFTRGWQETANTLPKPAAILCISAHWETNGTFVTAMEKPKTIHDFYGFPQELFDVRYPAPGSPDLAIETKKNIHSTDVKIDKEWGFDHGCWSVIKRMYPRADIPIIEMSLDHSKQAQWHYELGKELLSLRSKGILIIGSGNMVHNLRMADWEHENGFDWALEANESIKNHILQGDHKILTNYRTLGKEMQLAVPTPEHYLPLLYTLALRDERDTISFFNDKAVMGSISMTCVKIEEG
ncbi:MAG: 4,5-DOPA dioxygenase extradiol [Bacteroidota bacterium]